MAIPIIILGAGASFDYIHSNDAYASLADYQPPLTRDIFSPRIRGIAKEIIANFSDVEWLFGELNSAIRANQDFEQHLRRLRDENPGRKKQIVSFQYYLSHLFQLISDKYGKQIGNNYSTLVGGIKNSFEGACFITFNYDTLLEQSLFPKKKISNINTYVHDNYKLVKLHGSCDWVYPTPTTLKDIISFSGEDVHRYFINNPDSIRALIDNGQISMRGTNNLHDYPAIAMPIADKDTESFVCPENHIRQLTEALSQTDRILVIGWNASDPSLIKLIKEHVKKPTSLYVVCGSYKHISDKVEEKFEDLKFINVKNINEVLNDSYTLSKFLNSPPYREFMGR